jgi:hypothetical protein
MRFGYALILVAGLGCSKERGADCTKLVQTAGPQHAALSQAFGRSDQSPADLETEAVSFEKGAADLNALDLKDEAVKGIATDFASMLTRAAAIRRDQAAAAGGLDPAAAAKAQASATTFMVDEMKVKARLDTQCR